MPVRNPLHCILPPGVLEEMARTGDDETRGAALDALGLDRRFRAARAESAARRVPFASHNVTFARVGGKANRTIFDNHHSEDQSPGQAVRAEGQPEVADQAVNQAYDGLGATYDYYWQEFQRDSIDGQGMPIQGIVHFGTKYDNAFWDGNGHMFFGDGSGKILTETTAGLDVIGHELTHGVTQHEANLTYSGQSGALNESMSDVMGIIIQQRYQGQTVDKADWLIGANIVGPALRPALRSMKDPGKVNPYDRQVADMDHYIKGGDVHFNSGIPNRAFYVAATGIGGNAWDAAGPIWYETLCDSALRPSATFKQFATLTVTNAQRRCGTGSKEANAVHAAWQDTKVLK
jgi:Zn-dependent metalloprotease